MGHPATLVYTGQGGFLEHMNFSAKTRKVQGEPETS